MRSNGPTARVKEFAGNQPGSVISWSQAQYAYSTGIVKGYDGPRRGAAHHKMSISNVLRRHFMPVEGTRGLYVLNSSMENPDWDEDMLEMQQFHAIHGCDEFGMSLPPKENALQRRITRTKSERLNAILRMSEI